METADRIRMLQGVATRLAEQSDVNRDLIMRQFGLPVADSNDYWDEYAYALDRAEQVEEGKLTNLYRYFFPDEEGGLDSEGDDGDSPWRAGAFRLFVTHTTAHKERASTLATVLARAEVHAFVAHETLEPTREWQDVIEAALRTCDALCAIWTPDFVESRWCDQEIGMAVALRKLVVALKVGADPHGFIGKYQAIVVREKGDDARAVADRVLRALILSPVTSSSAAPYIVRRYATSINFDAARAGFALLSLVPRDAWTPSMIEMVDRAPTENNQIEHGVLTEGPIARIPDAATQLLKDIRPEPEPATHPPGWDDDQIPF